MFFFILFNKNYNTSPSRPNLKFSFCINSRDETELMSFYPKTQHVIHLFWLNTPSEAQCVKSFLFHLDKEVFICFVSCSWTRSSVLLDRVLVVSQTARSVFSQSRRPGGAETVQTAGAQVLSLLSLKRYELDIYYSVVRKTSLLLLLVLAQHENHHHEVTSTVKIICYFFFNFVGRNLPLTETYNRF